MPIRFPVWISVIFILLLAPAYAQQQGYACPQYSPQVRQKVVNDMVNAIKKRPYRGTRARPDLPLYPEGELMMQFYLLGLNYGEGRAFNAPWSVWANCIPELKSIKALNDQALAGAQEAERQQANAEQLKRQERQTRENEPTHLLTRTYYDYVVVRKCFEQRQGYVAVNISEQEMDRAKKAAKAIEDAILKISPGVDKDAAWKAATSGSDDWMTDGDQTDLMLSRYDSQLKLDQSDRNRCQNILTALEARLKKTAPETNAVKKDF